MKLANLKIGTRLALGSALTAGITVQPMAHD